jgi:hypothetical protein
MLSLLMKIIRNNTAVEYKILMEQTNKKWYMFSPPVSQSVDMEEIFLLYLDFMFSSIYDCVISLLFFSPDFILIGSFPVWSISGYTGCRYAGPALDGLYKSRNKLWNSY